MTSQFRKNDAQEEGLSEEGEEDHRRPSTENNNELFFEQQKADESGLPDIIDESIEERYRQPFRLDDQPINRSGITHGTKALQAERPLNQQIMSKDESVEVGEDGGYQSAVDSKHISSPEPSRVAKRKSKKLSDNQLMETEPGVQEVYSKLIPASHEIKSGGFAPSKFSQRLKMQEQKQQFRSEEDKRSVNEQEQMETDRRPIMTEESNKSALFQEKSIHNVALERSLFRAPPTTIAAGAPYLAPKQIDVQPKNPNACTYQHCIIVESMLLEQVIKVRRRMNRLDEKAQQELDMRLKVSYGDGSKKSPKDVTKMSLPSSTPPSSQMNVQRNRKKDRGNKDNDVRAAFNQEQIEPCECGTKYHRVCIREKIVTNFDKRCAECNTGYSIGFTDCYAIKNNVRPNYLGYMLVQEILFFLSLVVFSEVIRYCTMFMWNANNPAMLTQWYIILQTLTTSVTCFSLLVFGLRVKGIYCVREIEDIFVFDKSQKQALDYDSPAILSIFFQDIQTYEQTSKYYKKSFVDRFMHKDQGLLGTSLQRARTLVRKLNTTYTP